ncbi:uncharacterized protein LOC134765884 [Penaeus indicus]|uniref:uncharacterized protein LOC134765884 n=1 Tax=Penaeus indicus TaxID=29960 RepID=UPI00300CDA54
MTQDILGACDRRREQKAKKFNNNDMEKEYRNVGPSMTQTSPDTVEELEKGGPGTIEDAEPDIIRREVEHANGKLKRGKAAGVDNIPAELLQTGESKVTVLHRICMLIWKNKEWPTQWTQSLVIPIPKKGNLKQCNNYRTISLICHASKVMLRIIGAKLKLQIENILAEEQAGFREGSSTTEQICNIQILGEKSRDH